MYIQTTSEGTLNSLWMGTKIMCIHVNTTDLDQNAHLMHIKVPK